MARAKHESNILHGDIAHGTYIYIVFSYITRRMAQLNLVVYAAN